MSLDEPNSPENESIPDTVAKGAAQTWQTTKDKAAAALHTGKRYVREHPGTSVFSIFGAGLLIGALLGWSAAHGERDDYQEKTLKALKRLGKKLNLA